MNCEILKNNNFQSSGIFTNNERKLITTFLAFQLIGIASIILELSNPSIKHFWDYKQILFSCFMIFTLCFSIVIFFMKKYTIVRLLSEHKLTQGLFYIALFLLASTLLSGSSTSTGGYIILPWGIATSKPFDFCFFILMLLLALNSFKLKNDTTFIKCITNFFAPVLILVVIGTPLNSSMTLVMLIATVLFLYIVKIRRLYLFIFLVIAFTTWLCVFIPSARNGNENLLLSLKEHKSIELFDFNSVHIIKEAILNGGLFGKIGQYDKIRLPFTYPQYTFAWIINVYGIIGTLIVVWLYFIFFITLRNIYKNINDLFLSRVVLALGLMLLFVTITHILINIFCLPVGAVSLPLIKVRSGPYIIYSLCLGIILASARLDKKLKSSN